MLHSDFIAASEAGSNYLMVVLHGLGDSMEGYRWLPEALRLPWLNYLLVNAPDEYYGGYSWYDFNGDAETGVRRSRQSLTRLLEAQAKNGFPTSQTYLFGFSQGCLMTLETGLRHPSLFAGLIGISGYLLNPESLLAEMPSVAKQQRVLMTHGIYDPLLSIEMVRPQAKLLQQQGVQLDWREFPKEHTIAGEAEINVIREFVDGGRSATSHSKLRSR
jgi:phospholipase/carboxylesterase